MSDWVPNPDYLPPKAGEPPLHRAARVGDAEAIRSLAAEGADLNEVFDMGLDPSAFPRPATPLMVAAGSREGATVDTVKLLLDLGADPRLTLGEDSAATFACSGIGWNYGPGGDVQRLRLLLETGSPLPENLEALNGLLCVTAEAGDIARLKILLDSGANPNGYWNPASAKAKSDRFLEGMPFLGAGMPNPFEDLPEEVREQMAESMKEMIGGMSEAPSEYELPLFRAAASGNTDCVALVLERGADPLARDSSRRTAMYVATSLAVVRALLAVGVPIEDADTYGWSPLSSAVSDGAEGLPRVRALIDGGADVNSTHDHGYTVFMCGLGSERDLSVVRTLLAAGANPHAVSEHGYNAFHAAIDVNGEANAEESVRETFLFLKELGVDMEHRNNGGQTPLARAIESGTGIEVQLLCELGADVNAVCLKRSCGPDECVNLELPLLFHAVDGVGVEPDVKTEAMLAAGADVSVRDAEGFRPLECAVGVLCHTAPDYPAAYKAFFEGLAALGPTLDDSGSADEVELRVRGAVRQYTEAFAAGIPLSKDSQFARERREQVISCIVALCFYESGMR